MAVFDSLEAARAWLENDRFAAENGMRLTALGDGCAECAFDVTARHRNAEGGVMGGAILTLIDLAFAAASNNMHRPTVAQQASVSFLNAAKGSRLTARAVCRKDGKTSCVYDVDVTDDLGRDVAHGIFTGFKL